MKKYGISTVVGVLAMAGSVSVVAEEPKSTDLSVGMALDQGLSVVVELDNQYRFIVGNDGGAFDYILKRGSFEANTPVTWYVGAGAWSEWEGKDFGARLPLGLNWNLSKSWNMYGQIHPELNLYGGPELQIGGAIGVKYSF
ncbi:hypothetical protein [Vibrio bivalvicida]|uniref:Outer membrane protein beta-barrel domain-containing protein n=1 Tax=Vibrio bivalvicida TaxID=1276888 RepID=A0A177XZ55_9VIBR|nr:hypothetical protein [Vibrio bivalvicida]OAJ93867.1 hypothetical protein APB76_11635 [Vibrio bivalvicida]